MTKIKEKFVYDDKGKVKEVILPIKAYVSMKENYLDLMDIEERKKEDTMSLDELKQKLHDDGLI